LRDNAARAGELLALAIGQPQLGDADAARVKTQIAAHLAQLEESPRYHATRLLEQRAFAGSPYANPTEGTAASVAALSAQDVRDYLKTYVTRGNVLIAAAGDVDRGVLDDMLSPTIDALAENDEGPVPATQIAMQGGGETLRQTMAVPQSVVMFMAPAVPRDNDRFYAAYLLNQILGGSALISRLSDEVRQQKGLAYSTTTELDMRRGTSLLTGALATRNSQADAALAEVKNVLTALHDKGVTSQECADAKSYVLGALPLQLDSSTSVANTLLMMQIDHLGSDYLEERAELFKKVSCADINALAAELLQPQRFLIALVGGTTDGADSAAAVAPTNGGDIK
jgi:zinc protease